MQNIVVLGAAGKMGSGIALLLLQEIAWQEKGNLTLLDVNIESFSMLKSYLRKHLKRYIERSINKVREKYANVSGLVDNGDMVDQFVEDAMDRVRCVTSLEECRGADHIFEAIIEDVDIKAKVLKEVGRWVAPDACFFTNTSSIPIHVISEKSGLNGRLIGFHFYNPPPVQKLVEIIIPKHIHDSMRVKAESIGKALGKILIYSNDVAGFIGNGHFIREIMFACSNVRMLQKELTLTGAICAVNRVTQEYLLRPMGIFQLVDYVGIDICLLISKIMTAYLPNADFLDPLLFAMGNRGIKGGQFPDGRQKDGFLKYENGRVTGVYNLETDLYEPYIHIDRLGKLPEGCMSWKMLSSDKDRKSKIDHYFISLEEDTTLGGELARKFLESSKDIAEGLVRDNVARNIEDVDAILKYGFYHLYGVNEPFFHRSAIR